MSIHNLKKKSGKPTLRRFILFYRYVCIYAYVGICTWLCTRMRMYAHVCMHGRMYVCVRVRVYAPMKQQQNNNETTPKQQ